MQLVEKSAILKQAFQLEPRLYDVLREVNSLLVVEHRDLAYSTFKKKCERLVGFGAARPELRTSQHYLALLDFLGILISWVEEQPRLTIDCEPDDHASEDSAIDAAVPISKNLMIIDYSCALNRAADRCAADGAPPAAYGRWSHRAERDRDAPCHYERAVPAG